MFATRERRAAWLIGFVAVVASGVGSVMLEQQYATAQVAVHQALAVRQAISDTLSLLKDAETGQRGLLLTQDSQFLSPYVAAKHALAAQLGALSELVGSDDDQQRSVREIRRLADEKLGELDKTLELYETGQLRAAVDMVRSGRGLRLMDALRDETVQMLAHQEARVSQLELDASAGRRWLMLILLGSSVSFSCVIIWGVWSSARGIAEAKQSRERLRQGEHALRMVVDNADELVCIVGDGLALSYVSPSCQRILGYATTELLATPLELLFPEEERDAARRLAERVRHGHQSNEAFVHRLRSKSGTYRWFETHSCLVRGSDAQANHLHFASRDITQRRAAEEALRRQTARLESILDSMGDGVVVMDRERRLLIVNPAARQYIRQDEGEIVPTDWAHRHQAFLPDGKTPFPSEQGPLTRAANGESCDGIELAFHDRSGVCRSFSVTARPLYEQERPIGCVAVYRDVSEQRHAENDLVESQQRLRVLSEASFEGVAITKGGYVVDTNTTLAAWLGREPYELIGVDGLSLFVPEEHELVREKSTQPDVVYEAHMLRNDGTRLPVEVRGRHTQFRGETVRIAVVRDITDKRRRETELKNQAELLRTLSLRDELTSLYNRRGFQEHAQRQLLQAARTKRPATVFFLDLNGMKTINDTLGHEVGDRALGVTARLLTGACRESDIVARLGGDEFAVFAPDCDVDGTRAMRERLARHLDELNEAGGESFRLSIAVGTAHFDPLQPTELDELLEIADREMYEHKRARLDVPASSPAVPRAAGG
ncbi:MAG TPA: diguanylate cyclase [Polyangiaceae bacterium]|nr:diguanylate cyclase [Polyangiaceae bacterium]